MVLSQNIEVLLMAVLDITQNELVIAVEYQLPLVTYQHYSRQSKSSSCSVFAAIFLNLANFKCLPEHDPVSQNHDIFQNRCKRPHHATWKISHVYIEIKCHLLVLQENLITFEQGYMHALSSWWANGASGFFLPGIAELNNGCPVDRNCGVRIKEERGR